MCGEMAADPLAVPVLVGPRPAGVLGPPCRLAGGRSGWCARSSFKEARRIAHRALGLATAKEVEEYLLEQLSGLLSHLKVRIRL